MYSKNKYPEEETAFIYSIADPRTKEIRYIGRTTVSLKQRLSGHKSKLNYRRTYKDNWLRNIYNNDLTPLIELIDIVDYNEQDYWEKFYMSLFKTWGYNLVNLTLGSESIYYHTEETKRKQSLALKGKKHSKERNIQKSIALRKAFKENPEYGEKISKIAKLKFSNPENILKMVLAKGGKEFKVFKIEDKKLTYLFTRINKTHCSKELDIKNPVCIRRVLNKERKHTHNYYFEYIEAEL